MDIKRLAWKYFSINKDEFSFVFPLFLLYFISGSFYAVGQIFSETIFLKTYGPGGFSGFFIQNGIAIIIAGIIYNSSILRMPLRKGYILLISFISILVLSASFFRNTGYKWFPFYIYMANYLFTVFLDIHFFNYAFLHLTIRNSKRILPFVMGGGKLGGILSCLIIYYVFSRDISGFGFYVWAINGVMILIPLLLFKTKEMPAAKADHSMQDIHTDSGFLLKLTRNLRSAVSSGFFVYAVLIAFIVSIISQVSEYYFSGIFNSYFATKNKLSAFLSLYTLTADFITLGFQLFAISKLIDAIGVRKANLIYPVSFFSLLTICAAFPNLIIGILLRFLRKNASALIKTPVYNIIMAASPGDRMADVKSFIGGIVNSAGMIAGGLSIFLISRRFSIAQGYAFTILLAAVCVILVLFQNRSYVRTLAERIKFDSRTGREDGDELTIENYPELLADKDSISKNMSLIQNLFNRRPSDELLPVLNSNYGNLSNDTKEAMLNLIRAGRADSYTEIIQRGLNDQDPGIRAIALSLLQYRSPGFRKKVFRSRYPGMLYGEKIAVSILTGVDEDGSRVNPDDIAVEQMIRIRNGVMAGTLQPVEFIMLIQAIPYQYFLNHLYELLLNKRDMDLFKSIIPYADKLSGRRAVKLIYAFRNEKLDYLIRFIMLSKEAGVTGLKILLDHRDISYEDMKKLSLDDKAVGVLLPRLFKDISYLRKSNYLKFILSAGARPEMELERFIDFEIGRIKSLYGLLGFLYDPCEADSGKYSSIYGFLRILLSDIIEFNKHLILKAISIVTGFKIDDIYDSNILLNDRELDNYILEYMDSTVKRRKEVVSIFDGNGHDTDKVTHGFHSVSIDDLFSYYGYIKGFLPEISELTAYSFRELSGIIPSGSGKLNNGDLSHAKGEDMYSLIEKIVFLKDNNLFRKLKINELINLARIAREIEFPSDTTIIEQGESGDRLYIIINGEVKVFTRKREIETLGPGSCIGELSIIDDEPRSASIVALKKTKVLCIDRKDFLLTLKDNPEISISIMQVIAGRLRKLL